MCLVTYNGVVESLGNKGFCVPQPDAQHSRMKIREPHKKLLLGPAGVVVFLVGLPAVAEDQPVE